MLTFAPVLLIVLASHRAIINKMGEAILPIPVFKNLIYGKRKEVAGNSKVWLARIL